MGTQRPRPQPAVSVPARATGTVTGAAAGVPGTTPAPWLLAPFLETLDECLQALSADELRQAVLDHAQGLPAAQRAAFLEVFAADGGTAADDDPDLLADVDAFVAGDAAVAARADDAAGAAPVATRAAVWEHLLARAGRRLLAGDAATAAHAYRGLLDALADPGTGVPPEALDADALVEARHRYLRAVWESEPAPARVGALVEAVEVAGGSGERDLTIAAVEAARRAPLPELDVTLGDLVARLRDVEGSTPAVAPQIRRLLAEAIERRDGIDGLAELARTQRAGQADAYCDWIDGLVRVGRTDDAEDAAREGLDALAPDNRARARIAERLAALAAVRDDRTGVFDGCRAAWRADPTMPRLLALVATARALERSDAVLAAEADDAGDGRLARREGLAATVLLLAHRVDDAVTVLRGAPPGSWASAYGRPGAVVVPFLLVGASRAAREPGFDDTLLAALVDGADAVARVDGGGGDLREFRMLLAKVGDGGEPPALPGEDLRLSQLLLAAVAEHPADEQERAGWLDAGRATVLARVEDVVGGRHRSAYEQTARLAVACAEAIALTGGGQAGAAFVDEVHDGHAHDSAFGRALRTAAGTSPLL